MKWQLSSGGLAEHGLETVRFHVHRIRSGSLYLSVEKVGVPATALEEQIENGVSFDEIMGRWFALREAVEQFMNCDPTQLRMS